MKGNKEQREDLQETGHARRECNFNKSQTKRRETFRETEISNVLLLHTLRAM